MWFGGCWTCELDEHETQKMALPTAGAGAAAAAAELKRWVRTHTSASCGLCNGENENHITYLSWWVYHAILWCISRLGTHSLVSIGTLEFHRHQGSRYLDSYLIVYALCAFQPYTRSVCRVCSESWLWCAGEAGAWCVSTFQMAVICSVHITRLPTPIDDVVVVTWTNNISFYNEQVFAVLYTLELYEPFLRMLFIINKFN